MAMRIFISILTFCLFMAMVFPVTAEMGHLYKAAQQKTQCRMDCCQEVHHPQNKQHPNKDKGCCGDMACNPFMACSCCFACFFEKPSAHELFTQVNNFRFPIFNSDVRSRKAGDCFHPPEVV